MTIAQLLPEIMKLSRDEKQVLADALWRSLRSDEPVDEAEFRRELDRRVDDADKHPENLISWEDVLKKLGKSDHL